MKTRFLHLCLIIFLLMGVMATAQPVKADGEPPVWPLEGFWNDPADPSIFDTITFGLYGYAPAEYVCHWDFGNGTTSDDCFAYQAVRYENDGDYTVSVQVTNELAEKDTASRVISVRTHDVAITRFTVPQSARAGQTRQIVVSVSNTRYPEDIVEVDLYKSTAEGYVLCGILTQFVPVRPSNRTTAFTFNYTFTKEDAYIGKVTFRAMVIIGNNVRDAHPADNEVVALPTKVFK